MPVRGEAREVLRVAVVVVGDLGRSPRMQGHALALASRGAEVDLVGYGDSAVFPEIESDPRIRIHQLRLPVWMESISGRGLRYLVGTSLKLVLQHLQLFGSMSFGIRRPAVLLVQSPPALPTLPVAWVAARLVLRCKLIVDWHNFGWKVLGQRLGDSHPIVRALERLEPWVGGFADAHFCVSRAMQERLLRYPRFRSPLVLLDRPQQCSEQATAASRREQLRELGARIREPALGRDGVALVVCPTSFTRDEDLEMLLEALEAFDERLCGLGGDRARESPRVLILLTGRGELRSRIEERIARSAYSALRVVTTWLSHRDYRLLLRGADLGLCLHRSASGVDLPYKVPEMFGAGIPLGVLDYGSVIEECCRPGIDCFVFTSARELAASLHDLLGGFPDDTAALERLRAGGERVPFWQEEWDRVAAGEFGWRVDQSSQSREAGTPVRVRGRADSGS